MVTESPGIVLGANPTSGSVAIAIHGVVDCRVEADTDAITAGDVLIASSVVGYACRAPDDLMRQGSILGKALAPMGSGRGTLPILLGG